MQIAKKTVVKKSSYPLNTLIEVPIDSVKYWKDNPRKNDKAAIELAELIKIHKQISPVVVWAKNMVIYKGNTTKKAMTILGSKTIKAIFVDFPSEQAAIAYGIADNKSSELSSWDDTILRKFLDIKEVQLGSGFSSQEMSFIHLNDFDVMKDISEEQAGSAEHCIISIKVKITNRDKVISKIKKTIGLLEKGEMILEAK
jgi:hypothetical protein